MSLTEDPRDDQKATARLHPIRQTCDTQNGVETMLPVQYVPTPFVLVSDLCIDEYEQVRMTLCAKRSIESLYTYLKVCRSANLRSYVGLN